jgi:hypothetical protein
MIYDAPMRTGSLAGIALASLLTGACVAPLSDSSAPGVAVGGSSALVDMFARVGTETGVPAELLATMSYVGTRLRFVSAEEHGRTTLGLLGLSRDDLLAGAALAGITDHAALTEPEASVRAGAALLKSRDPSARTLGDFLSLFDGDERTALTDALIRGSDGRDASGNRVTIAARPELDAHAGLGTVEQGLGNADYGPASWSPAYAGNYAVGNRTKVSHIVIHDTEGSYAGTISWFKDPAANVSAHYVIKSSTGAITQMVKEKDTAWHDACFNTTTVGIEHEGYAAHPEQWFTEPMYVASAKLTAYLADKYSIPKERGFIVGHGEAPDCSDHTDPGPGWNWAHYIDLVKTGGAPTFLAGDAVIDAPTALVSGETATVTITITNNGNVAWDLDLTRVGTALPQDRESAIFLDGDWVSPSRPTGVDARVVPGATGTFTFDIVAPNVREVEVVDEAFQLVQDGGAWFGPEMHVVFSVAPKGDSGGCSATGGGSAGTACAMLLLGVLGLSRPRRRRRRAVRGL